MSEVSWSYDLIVSYTSYLGESLGFKLQPSRRFKDQLCYQFMCLGKAVIKSLRKNFQLRLRDKSWFV